MLPATYQLPAAIVLLIGGIVACFFGYRLFRIVLAIFGFIIGALAASSVFGVSDTGPMLAAALVGGLIGAGVLIAAYFVGVALVGAGSARRRRTCSSRRADQRPAFPGAGALHDRRRGGRDVPAALLHHRRHRVRRRVDADRRGDGAGAAIRGRSPAAAAAANVWVAYPLNPAPGQRWVSRGVDCARI